jgi:hypothetical protein
MSKNASSPTLPAILSLIDLFYAAATDPPGWPLALERLASLTGSHAGTFQIHDLAAGAASASWFTGWDPAAVANWDHHWAARNVYAIKGAQLVETGAVIPDE